MNKQEEYFFWALSKDRDESAKVLKKPSMRGIQNSVVEKYSDQAHFIYELLQNADDARATSARFILESNRLIFAHNGTRHFSVTNPEDEEQDTENGTLGDINAITSIANSNKTEASIGKFGVGFKAVFQYTSTPHIYDPIFRFRIDRFIVPSLLDEDFPGRRPEETLFVFPFDHSERDAIESYNDISDKLRNLSYPLLFLSNITGIEYEFKDVLGLYGKEVKETRYLGETLAEHICLTQNNGDDIYDENLWLFSREDEFKRRYSAGYFMTADGKICPVRETAFCFFPTKEVTGLNFIIHAPFLLTDSREGIRAGVPYNDRMLQRLATLSADALEYLRDIGEQRKINLISDDIFEIIPFDRSQFSAPDDKRKVSFLPFYEAIRRKMDCGRLLPSADGCVSKQNAYWASVPQIPQLFSNEQLGEIVENKEARWVFVSYGRDETQKRNNKALFNYLDALTRTNLNEDVIISGRSRDYYGRGTRQSLEVIKGITAEFIEAQSLEWLHLFYKWLSETKHRTDSSKYKPFFLDQDGKACPAFAKANHSKQPDHSILFLPARDIEGYRVINPELLKNPDTYSFIVKQIGIKQPSLKDHIYNIILPMYHNGGEIDADSHFKLFFEYFCKWTNDDENEFTELIKECDFLRYCHEGETQGNRGKASSMYLPLPDLVRYFVQRDKDKFIDYNKYMTIVGKEKEKRLITFLLKLGIHTQPQIIIEEDNQANWKESELYIDGLLEYLSYVENEKNVEDSIFLWKQLCLYIDKKILTRKVFQKEISTRPDRRYRFKTENIESTTARELKNRKWLVDVNGAFDAPMNLSLGNLFPGYPTDSDEEKKLLELLSIPKLRTHACEEDDTNLTDSQKELIEFAKEAMARGIDRSKFQKIEEYLRQEKAKNDAKKERVSVGAENDNAAARGESQSRTRKIHENNDEDFWEDELTVEGEESSSREESLREEDKRKPDKKTLEVVKDIVKRTKRRVTEFSTSVASTNTDELDIDQDEYTPAPTDLGKKIERTKQKSAAEIEKIVYLAELQERALESQKYSYGWFTSLLEMESINSGEANTDSKAVSICFAKVEKDIESKRTLILSNPDRYIPQFIEDLADIPLVLHMGDQTKTVAIEVVSIKSYTLHVKIKNIEAIDDIDLSTVTSATIDTKSPVFLIEALRKQFLELGEERGFADNYNMQENLCKNIEFVFGPPGTGKTTHLAKNVLIPMMQNNSDCKVLVLTPTNKSADVLVRRIMEVSEEKDFNNWLVRFGSTSDDTIERSTVFRDKTFDIRTLRKSVTVTTIARFPYDYFMPKAERIYLYSINWDYIVIDEASMIPVANIVFPLYKKTPRKFIIAGDPFQIEPITSVDLWKNENIYTMVHLDSFTAPKTVPHEYKVELLTTQYRSIPDIGYVFSNFAYGGILKHHRSAESQRQLKVGDDLGVETLNIIKFPVSKYESIYRCKRLQHSSSYQVYSALFVYEYVIYLSKAISASNPGSRFNIGVIAPYRAQADLIEKLLTSEKKPKEVNVQVGTIHGFQGDECDIIFVIFNPPPTISASKDMFLNKLNIINVAISRARDYLFVVMPDDDTENITNLRRVRRVEHLMHDTDTWNEFLSPDLEELMFGDHKYLENNAFTTSHQSVNVYGLPEKRYEVRTEDTAVDVQVHKSLIQKPVSETLNDQSENRMTQLPGLEFEPNDLDESLIPEELRADAVDWLVCGAINGWCYLVPYRGKVKSHTDKKTVGMLIPLIKDGYEKMITVSVVEEDRLIYISYDIYKKYEDTIGELEEIELRNV